jgi:hypothetical protein
MALNKEFWKELLAISGRNEKKMRQILLEAAKVSSVAVTSKALAGPMEIGDAITIELLIDWSKFDDHLEDYKSILAKTLYESGEATARWLSEGLKTKVRFDMVDPYAVEWINQHAAELVRYIDNNSKQAIREIIRDGFQQGITPDQMAKRIQQHIGLDPQRSRALAKYRSSLLEGGVPPGEVNRLAEKFSKRLLKARSLGIAINESLEASARGQFESTKQAVARGVIDPNEWEGYRIVTPDDRLCPTCSYKRGETRSLPDGRYSSTGRQEAKVHNSCRCCEGLRRK